MSEWKEITSAPKDGRWFFVKGPDISVPAHCRWDSSVSAFVIHPAEGVHPKADKSTVDGWIEIPEPPK